MNPQEPTHAAITLTAFDALIIVDVQRDFCLGGALPVPHGDQIVPILNTYIMLFTQQNAHIYATRDWHPPNHISFKEFGGIWPPHCIQHSTGAQFHPDLHLPQDVVIISKASTPRKEAYSGFDEPELLESLRKKRITRLFIGGLATDYCVKNTALDALQHGFTTILLVDAMRGIDNQPNDSTNAIEKLIRYGARTAILSDFQMNNDASDTDRHARAFPLFTEYCCPHCGHPCSEEEHRQGYCVNCDLVKKS